MTLSAVSLKVKSASPPALSVATRTYTAGAALSIKVVDPVRQIFPLVAPSATVVLAVSKPTCGRSSICTVTGGIGAARSMPAPRTPGSATPLIALWVMVTVSAPAARSTRAVTVTVALVSSRVKVRIAGEMVAPAPSTAAITVTGCHGCLSTDRVYIPVLPSSTVSADALRVKVERSSSV